MQSHSPACVSATGEFNLTLIGEQNDYHHKQVLITVKALPY